MQNQLIDDVRGLAKNDDENRVVAAASGTRWQQQNRSGTTVEPKGRSQLVGQEGLFGGEGL